MENSREYNLQEHWSVLVMSSSGQVSPELNDTGAPPRGWKY